MRMSFYANVYGFGLMTAVVTIDLEAAPPTARSTLNSCRESGG